MRIIKLPTTSGSAYLEFCFLNGSQTEPEGFKGVSHLIEHLHFRDASGDELKEKKRDLESLGVILNAYTSEQRVGFHAGFLPEHFKKVCEVLKRIVYQPSFLDEDIEIEKSVVVREIIDYEDQPSTQVNLKFKNHIYDKNYCSVMGLKEDVLSCNSDKIKELYKNIFGLHNLVVILSGPEEFLSSVENEEFLPESTTLRKYPKKLIAGIRTYQKPSLKEEDSGLGSVYYRSGFIFPFAYHPDQREAYKIRTMLYLASEMLGGSQVSPLYEEVREKRGYAYTMQSGYMMNTRDDLFIIAGQLNPESYKSAIVVIENVIRTFYEDYDLFEFAKQKLINGSKWAEVSPELRASDKLIELLSDYKIPSEKFLNEEITYDQFRFYINKLGCFDPSKFFTFILK
jgi:predicted Zn-dependent peptidase